MLLNVGARSEKSQDDEESGRVNETESLKESYQVVVDCGDEQGQREVYQRMTSEGYKCRVLTL